MKKTRSWLIRPIVVAVSSCFGMPAWANPTGAQVMQGTAAFQRPDARTLNVTNSPGAVINWQGFSVGASEITRFIQQSTSSAVLNRVVGADISQIQGQLLSNGRVFLINPAGILIGAGAIIDTAGFVGSTLNMLDADFLAGKLKFQGDASSGSIKNEGWIRTGYGGNVMLIAPHIENGGVIQTPGGELLLAAGQKVTIGSLDPNDVQFEVQAPTDSVLNIGKLIAQGGAVGALAGTLKHTGDIRADALVRDEGGRVVLKALGGIELAAGSTTSANGRSGGDVLIQSNTGQAQVAGQVSATGSAGAGGDIRVLADDVSITRGASIDASGSRGGGQIRVGGDYQGANPALQNASSTTIEADAVLKSDATSAGDGGRIIVWADKNTQFYGGLSARGGAQGGNGGFAEVSGKEALLFAGSADLGASNGALGNLLLDPLDLYVRNGGGQFGNILGSGNLPNNAVTVAPSTLAAIVGNVSLFASRYMLIDGAVNLTTAGQSLTAEVGTYTPAPVPGTPLNQLDISQNITTNGGAVTLTAPKIQSLASATIATGGGAVSLTGSGSSAAIQGSQLTINAGTGAVTAVSPNSVQLGGVTGGSFLVNVPGFVSIGLGGITTTGAVSLTSTGSSISSGNIASGGGDVTATASSSVSLGGVAAGAGNVAAAGTSVSAGVIDTTGNVTLTGRAGGVNATVNNAASVEATSSTASEFVTASVNVSSTTALNAKTLNATATGCSASASNFCASAFVNANATGNVNVGSVIAAAGTTTAGNKSATVNVSSTQGSILPMTAASQITAGDVSLSTARNSGGGIGSAAVALNTAVERSFTFRPNGQYNVLLNGTGPNQLNIELGVAATGQSYNGVLMRNGGGINLASSATDTTVTVNDFTLAGFNQRVFNSTPSVSLRVPDGALVATAVTVPEGDTAIPVAPSFTATAPLPAAVSASGNLTVNSYTRQSSANSLPKSTSFASDTGTVTLGMIRASKDPVSVSAAGDVVISNSALTTAGNVSVSSSAGSITIGQIDTTSGTGAVTLSAPFGKVAALSDSVALEVLSGSSASLTGQAVGESTFANPFDLAASSVALTSRNAGGMIGYAGRPIVANTANLTINATNGAIFNGSAGATFNVSTGSTALTNLNVFANPGGVGNGGLAQVRTEAGQPNDRTYSFASDGSNFAFATGNVPATQFVNGSLSFNSNAGNIALGNSNIGPTGSLAVTAGAGSITGSPLLDGKSIQLAAGTGVGGGAVTLTTGDIGTSIAADMVQLTAGGASGLARAGSIQTGSIEGASNGSITLNTFNGNIAIGPAGNADIGSAAARAGSVTLLASPGAAGATGTIQAGNIFGSAISLTSLNNAVTTGNLDALSSVGILSRVSATTGTLDGKSVSISNDFFLQNFPVISVGAIGNQTAPSSITLVGQTPTTAGTAVNLLGPVTGAAGSNITIFAGRNGAVRVGGPIVGGDGTSINLNHAGDVPFRFSTLNAGVGGSVSINSSTAIEQTADGAGTGITANNVNLAVTNGSMTNTADPAGLLDLNSVTRLQVAGNGRMAFDAHGNTLQSIQITKNATVAAAPFELANLGSGQVVTMASAPSDMTLVARSPTTPLDFNLRNTAGGIALASGIVTSGGNVTLSAEGPIDASNGGINTGGATGGGAVNLSTSGGSFSGGTITTGPISTIPTGTGTGGSISVTTNWAPGDILISGDLQTGSGGGGIAINAANQGSVTRGGGARIIAGQVTVNASNGAVGSAAAPLSITSPNVTLSASDRNAAGAGFVFATLDGATQLGLSADNGFNVSSNAAFGTLSVNTKGSGTGTPAASTLNLAAAGQTYGFARPTADAFGAPITNTFQVISGGGATPPASATFNALQGDLLVTGDANLSSPTLNLGTLGGDGDVKLQGTSATPLALNNPTQNFRGPRDLLITGNVAITGTNQTLSAQRDLTVQARDGSVVIAGGAQNISATNGTLSFIGGVASDETVTITADASQRIFTPENVGGNALFRGGAGDRANVNVRFTGPNVANNSGEEEQLIQVHGNVLVEGGSGANSDATITTATADQLVRAGNRFEGANLAIGNISVTAGTGGGSDARITNTGTGYQQIGESRQSCGQSCVDFTYQTRNITVQGQSGVGSAAEITATGPQQFYSRGGTLSVIGGRGANATAKVESTSTTEQQVGLATYLSSGNAMSGLAVRGGTGAGSTAAVTSPNAQRITVSGAMSLTADGTNASATVSGATQDIRFGSLTLAGGAGDNAAALMQSAKTQNLAPLSGGNTIALNGGAGTASSVRINSAGAQTLRFSSLSMSGGGGAGSFAKIDTPVSQSLTGGSVTLTAGGTSAAPVSNAGATIEGQSQTITGAAIALNGGAGNPGAVSDAILRNLAGSQTIRGSSVVLTGGNHDSTTGILNAGTGTQTVFGSGGIALMSDPGAPAQISAPVLIQNTPATAQTICTVFGTTCAAGSFVGGSIALTNSGAGVVAITSAGDQVFKAQSVGVSTSAGSTGDATLNSTGTQWIHTSNPASASQPSLRVASLGTGKASVESGSTQLLEIDYPDVMTPGATLRGDFIVGDAAAVGTSLVQAADQAVFAGRVSIASGSGAGSLSKLSATTTQAISTTVGGIQLVGGTGAGATATVDPTLQNIVSTGAVDMTGAGGPVSFVAGGPQTLIVTNGALNMSGSGPGSLATINTSAPQSQQIILASGGINLGAFASVGSGPETTPGSAISSASANQVVRGQDELDAALLQAASDEETEKDARKRQAQLCR